jgi:hypothetical protein
MKKWVLAAAVVVVGGVATTVFQLRKSHEEPSEAPAPAQEPAALAPVASLVGAAEPQASSKKGTTAPPAPTVPANPTDPQGRSSQVPGKLRIPPVEQSSPAASGTKTSVKSERSGVPAKIRREGSRLIGLAGSIRQRGDRFELVPADGGPNLVILENQILERVDAMQSRQAAAKPVVWTVSGLVTEYRGTNYLLLDQASLGAGSRADKTPNPAKAQQKP